VNFEELKKGGSFFKATVTTNGFALSSIDEQPDNRKKFVELAGEVEAAAAKQGYDVMTHPTSRDPFGIDIIRLTKSS
jgi:hypothetical protein